MPANLDRRAHDIVSQLQLADGGSRDRILSEQCSGDGDLRVLVERLWAGQRDAADSNDSRPPSVSLWESDLPVALRQTLDGSDVESGSVVPGQAAAPGGLVGTRFTCLRKLGEGGQGEVWLTLDPQLDRHVALKVIRPTLRRSKAVRVKFRREAEVTSKLEHPGIVPIYEASGEDAAGDSDSSPFYVMRVYRGQTLHDAIELFHRESWSEANLRDLLRQFVDVCDAVGYAHSRGVIHRDLKPLNVMLGEFGETLVVDWGLARIVGTDDIHAEDESGGTISVELSGSETADGSILGTPQYMSPEQARGEIRSLGPPADIYSLGAILYAILTGQPSVSGTTVHEVLDGVREGRVRDPRVVNANVPKALSAVCRKALARNASDRYASAVELAADITRWMNDQPVKAWSESLLSRSRRWIRTHPTLTATTAVAVQMLALTLLVLVAVISSKNAELADANDSLDVVNAGLVEANSREKVANRQARASADEATRERDEAEASRQLAVESQQLAEASQELAEDNARAAREAQTRAESNADTARQQTRLAVDTLKSVISDIRQDQNDLPGDRTLRRKLLATALGSLGQIADEFADAGSVDRQTSVVLSEMAELVLKVGLHENDLDFGAIEATSPVEFARRLLTHALRIDRNLAEANPQDDQTQRHLSIGYENLGNVHRQTGDGANAISCYRHALQINRRLAESEPTDFPAQRDLAISYQNLGELHLESRNPTTALEEFEKCHVIRVQLAEDHPRDPDVLRELAISSIQLGDISLQTRSVDDARESYQESRAVLEQLAASYPTDARLTRDLSVLSNKQGAASLQVGDTPAAATFYEAALELASSLAEADPDHFEVKRDLSVSYDGLGDVRLRLDAYDAALKEYRASREILWELAQSDPGNAQAQNDLVVSHFKLGETHRSSHALTEAVGEYQSGIAVLDRMIDADQNVTQSRETRRLLDDQMRSATETLALACGDWDRLLRQPAGQLPRLLAVRCVESASKGQTQVVAQAARELRKLTPLTPESLYQAACAFAWCASTKAVGGKQDEQQLLELSLQCLHEAIDAGFDNFPRNGTGRPTLNRAKNAGLPAVAKVSVRMKPPSSGACWR